MHFPTQFTCERHTQKSGIASGNLSVKARRQPALAQIVALDQTRKDLARLRPRDQKALGVLGVIAHRDAVGRLPPQEFAIVPLRCRCRDQTHLVRPMHHTGHLGHNPPAIIREIDQPDPALAWQA